MGGALTRGSRKGGEALVRSVAKRIALDAPRLADLGAEELGKLARIVVAESLKDDLRREAELAGVDYQAERSRFLAVAERRSRHTAKAYRRALDLHDAWAARQGVAPLALTPALADDWIQSMAAEGASPATVSLRVAGASAFWTWMERRHSTLRNPFRGTRARPKAKPARILAVPSAEEIAALREDADPALRVAVSIMAELGLRVGALPELVVHGGKYTAYSKGKALAGTMPAELVREIERAGLPLRAPFGGETANTLRDRFRYVAGKLHASGKLAARYSVHDLRHAAAVRLYTETHDVYRVSRALAHAGVGVTERYLRSIGIRTEAAQ